MRILKLFHDENAAYMEAITKEGSPDFIPVENRIAVFDFDGTLFCETDPNYFDYTLLVYRVTEDPEYKDRASEFEKMVAAKIIDQNTNGTKYAELPVEHGQAVASAFKGMTMREFLEPPDAVPGFWRRHELCQIREQPGHYSGNAPGRIQRGRFPRSLLIFLYY